MRFYALFSLWVTAYQVQMTCWRRLRATISREMIRALLVLFLSTAATAKPWKPHPIKVIPGVPLKPDDIKPYVAPKLAPEPPLDPTTVKSIVVQTPDAVVNIRPWSSPLVGTVAEGTRVAVKGTVKAV